MGKKRCLRKDLERDSVEMSAHVWRRSLGSCCVGGVDRQSHAATTSLGGITFTGHAALRLGNLAGAIQLVSTEALSTILGACHGEPSSSAIGGTLGIGDLVVANVCKLDAGKNTSVSVLVATIVVPSTDLPLAGYISRGRAGHGYCSILIDGRGDP